MVVYRDATKEGAIPAVLANEWVPFNRKIDFLSHFSQELVTSNYIIRQNT